MLTLTALLSVVLGTSSCTAAPAPTPPRLEVLAAPRHALRLRVVGTGAYCAGANWSADADAAGAITLHAAFDVDAPACPATCAIVVTIRGAAAGAHAVTLDGTTVHARAR